LERGVARGDRKWRGGEGKGRKNGKRRERGGEKDLSSIHVTIIIIKVNIIIT